MGWLWVLNRRSTVSVGNFGIISPLNCHPMSVRMALNIPKQFITFLSIFILFCSESGYQGYWVRLFCWYFAREPRSTDLGRPVRSTESHVTNIGRLSRTCGSWHWCHLMLKPLDVYILVIMIIYPLINCICSAWILYIPAVFLKTTEENIFSNLWWFKKTIWTVFDATLYL